MDRQLAVPLTDEELRVLIEALDAYEYWQLGDTLPRSDGLVFIPGDLSPDDDRYWGAEPVIDPEAEERIASIRACRALAERLAASL